MMSRLGLSPVLIENGESLSSVLALRDSVVVGIVMPASWTTADLTLQASYDGITFTDVYNMDGNEYSITASAARVIVLSPLEIQWAKFLKVRSGTSATPITQGADRTLNIITRSL